MIWSSKREIGNAKVWFTFRVVNIGLNEKVTFEQRLERGREGRAMS